MIIDSPIISGSYAATGSLSQIGNVVITGSLTVTGDIIGNITGSATNAVSASYAAAATSASFAQSSTSASYSATGTSASYAASATSASFSQNALTASYLSNYIPPFPYTGSAGISGSLTVNGDITSNGTLTVQTLHVQTITSSVDFVTGSTHFGSIIDNTHQFTGSVSISGSLAVGGPTSATLFMNPQTLGDNVVVPSGYNALVLGPVDMSSSIEVGSGSNLIILESFTNLATTGSNSFTGDQTITGSLEVTQGITGSLLGTASFAVSASQAEKASTATSASYATTASYASNVPATSSFAVSASQAENTTSASFAQTAISASYALTASYISGSGGGVGFPFSGSAVITGSLLVTNLGGSGSRYLVTDNLGNIASQDATASVFQVQTFTASAGQTTFTISNGYSTGLISVYINGTKLNPSEYTDTSGTNIVLLTGSFAGDIVEFNKYLPAAGVTNNSLRQITYFTASAGQTTFSASYTPGLLDIFYNGSKLDNSEYTANNGTFFTLATASAAGDKLEVGVYSYQVGAFSGIGGSGAASQISYFNTSNSITGSPNFTISGSTMTVTGSLIISGSTTITNTLNTNRLNVFDANYNTLIGGGIGVTGYENLVLGDSGLLNGTVGDYNVVIGASSQAGIQSGSYNISMGLSSLEAYPPLATSITHSGSYNTAIGNYAMQYIGQGSYNVALGQSALQGYTPRTGSASYNVAIGYSASYSASTAVNNVAIGYKAGSGITVGSYNTILGAFTGSSTLSNTIILADGQGNVGYRYSGSAATITGSLTVTGTITAQTLVIQTITSSIVYSSGSNIFGNSLANTQTFTGSVGITGSLTTTGSIASTGNVTFGGTGYFGNDVFTYNNGGIFFSGGGSFASGIFQNANGLNLQTGTTPRVTINSSGNIGIGITNPNSNSRLHVYKAGGSYDTIVADGDVGTNTGFAIYEGGTAKYALYSNGAGGNDSFNIYNFGASANSLTILANSNVGIGTTNPAARLVSYYFGGYTSNLGDNIVLSAQTDGGGVGTYTQIGLGYNNGSAGNYYPAIIASVVENSSGQNAEGIAFATRNSTVGTTRPTERLRITNGGKVGIGSTNPNNVVDIYDSTYNSNTVGVLAARTRGGGTFITGRTVTAETSNQTLTIATCSASGGNERIFIKVQVVNTSAVSNYGNVHVGYALWNSSGGVSVTTMTLDTGNSNIGNTNVGTLSWSGNNLQYTTNRAGNYELNSITIWASARDTGVVS